MKANRRAIQRVFVATLFVSAAMALFFAIKPLAGTEKQLIFAINLPPSLLGEGAADIIGDFNKLKKSVAQKTGYSLRIDPYPDWDNLIDGLKKGEADVAWLSAFRYARFKASDRSNSIIPLVTMSIAGSRKSTTCLYVRKDSGIKNFDGLISKRVAFPDESEWVLLYLMFDDKKYPFAPYDFFSKHEEITRESESYALHLKQVDAIVIEPAYLPLIEKSIKGFRNEIIPLSCTQPLTNTLLVYRKGLSAEKVEKVKKYLLNMHKDTQIGDASRFFKISNVQWVDAKNETYSDWTAIYTKAQKSGWIRDYQRLEQ